MFNRSISVLFLAGALFSGSVFAASSPTYPVLAYSTYLRDSFTPKAIATDTSGNIYMAGNVIVDAVTSQVTTLVVKLNPQATQYVYIRYLGGTANDQANAIAVDGNGNAYIAGSTLSPDFPVTAGGNLTTNPPGGTPQRSFVAKLDPNGNLVFADLLGGFSASSGLAVAVDAAGHVFVSGISTTSGFPSTGGAYSVSNTADQPYLMKFDPTGATIFSATGIGGNAIAVDSLGDIYVAGTTFLLNYPTTPGSYQPAFPVFTYCPGIPCFSPYQGPNQYVTKVDPTGSKLIYSTSVSGMDQTTNAGLAVDSAGDVYLTGYAGPSYPFTAAAPTVPEGGVFTTFASPFLTKLDPTGSKLLFSVPVGGAGVQIDSNGSVYVAGDVGLALPGNYSVSAPSVPALAGVPAQCLPNITSQTVGTFQVINESAYVAQVDGGSGNVLGTQFLGGSTLVASAIVLTGTKPAGSTVWIAGATSHPDFPFTPNALTLANFIPTSEPGAYLGAVDFSQPQPPAGTPQIGCIVDAADYASAGPAVPLQLLTVYGTGLGPTVGVGAAGDGAGSLAGVSANFGGTPAPLLYVSATQINLAVPPVTPYGEPTTPMQIDVNGIFSQQLEVPLTYANPSLFLNANSQQVVALNADGTLNSITNPTQLGSTISIFVNGLSPNPEVNNAPLQLYTTFGWSVKDTAQATPYVLRVDLQAPAALQNDFSCPPQLSVCSAFFIVYDIYNATVSPEAQSTGGLAFGGAVYITP
jgi:uncharacterized protein (TIGR03437 family)